MAIDKLYARFCVLGALRYATKPSLIDALIKPRKCACRINDVNKMYSIAR